MVPTTNVSKANQFSSTDHIPLQSKTVSKGPQDDSIVVQCCSEPQAKLLRFRVSIVSSIGETYRTTVAFSTDTVTVTEFRISRKSSYDKALEEWGRTAPIGADMQAAAHGVGRSRLWVGVSRNLDSKAASQGNTGTCQQLPTHWLLLLLLLLVKSNLLGYHWHSRSWWTRISHHGLLKYTTENTTVSYMNTPTIMDTPRCTT